MRLFDEINNLPEEDIVDVETYFDDMELSDEEKISGKNFPDR